MTFGLASFFKYYDLPLALKKVIPNTSMKLEDYTPSLEDLQKLYRLNDLPTKFLLSVMRDCPARVGDLVKIVLPQLPKNEFMIKSDKENVVGKCYFSDSTIELFNQMIKANLILPTTERGLSKMIEKACKIANLPMMNPHLFRKFFFSVGVNLNINEITLKVLMFKSVGKDVLTYILNKNELKESWNLIVNAMPLEPKNGNGRVKNIEESLDLVFKVLRRMVEKEMARDGNIVMHVKCPDDKTVLMEYLGE